MAVISLIKHPCHVSIINDICIKMALIHSLMDITWCKTNLCQKSASKTCVKTLIFIYFSIFCIFIYFHYLLSKVSVGKCPLKRKRMVRWVPDTYQFPSKMIPCRWIHLSVKPCIAIISAFIATITKKHLIKHPIKHQIYHIVVHNRILKIFPGK